MNLIHAARMAVVLAAAMTALIAAGPAVAAVDVVVTSTADEVDANPGDGACATAAGACTLRAAIAEVNAAAGGAIEFDIPGDGLQTITAMSPLPAMTAPMVLDASTQPGDPGSPRVALVAPSSFADRFDGDALTLEPGAAGSVVHGLAIGNFRGAAIRSRADDVHLSGMYLGVLPGASFTSRLFSGIVVEDADRTRIGGRALANRNVITGAGLDGGVVVRGGQGTEVIGNLIGPGPQGERLMGFANAWGVDLDGATGALLDRNVITYNSSGVRLQGGGGHRLVRNRIGVGPDGESGRNDFWGVLVSESPDNVIGGRADGAGNVVSASGVTGIGVQGAGSRDTRILGNTIGGDPTGTRRQDADGDLYGNRKIGVEVDGAPDTVIGAPGAGNHLTLNGALAEPYELGGGIVVRGAGAERTVIQGNIMGLDRDGAAPTGGSPDLGNGGMSIRIDGAPQTVVGGKEPGAGNVIAGSGYGLRGISTVMMGGSSLLIEGTGARGTRVLGNLIGTDATGRHEHSDNGHALVVLGAPATVIGGLDPRAGNVIAGPGDRSDLLNVSIVGADGTRIVGNLIGTDATATQDFGGGSCGLIVADSRDTLVRANTILGSSASGVQVGGELDGEGAPADDTRLIGNRIGVDGSGMRAVPNERGVSVIEGARFVARDNVVSGNVGMGIRIAEAVTGAKLVGNLVGTNAAGTRALPNGHSGIHVLGGGTRIGGELPGQGNTISGNRQAGVRVEAPDAVIVGNRIGTGVDERTPLGNGEEGVQLGPGISNTQVGGVRPGARNVIAHNALDGVFLSPELGVATIRGNSTFANGTMSWDLGERASDGSLVLGPTANDPLDADTGANGLLNVPELQSARRVSRSVAEITGRLSSAPNETFTIDLYRGPASDADPSGRGEARHYVGSIRVRTDANGEATFVTEQPVRDGMMVSAATVAADGATSELSEVLILGT